MGERRNRTAIFWGLPSGSRWEKSVKISTLRRLVGSASSESSHSRLSSSSSISPASMSMSAFAISPSSRTSGLVKAAWAGPRRPSTRISLTLPAAKASIA